MTTSRHANLGALQVPEDRELEEVFTHVQLSDPYGERFNKVIRGTYDQLYDGQRTGRYRWEQLHKTEKTHFGTLVEINAQREFAFDDGDVLDYLIGGHEVDCKFSQGESWMLPPEVFGRLCLVITASDQDSSYSVGLVRAREEFLGLGRNRDAKATLSASGRAAIRWLCRGATLTPNLLLQTPADLVARIMDTSKSGQARINELFRLVQLGLVTRTVVATVARQDDYMKRVRYNGGARSALRPEGIVILGGDFEAHRAVAESLDLPVPAPGSFVSARLAPCVHDAAEERVLLDGQWWRLAFPEDPVVAAPMLPTTRRGEAA